MRFYEEMNQDSKVEAEAIEDAFRKKYIEDAKKRLGIQNSMTKKGKKEMRRVLSVVDEKYYRLRGIYSSRMSIMQGSSLYYCTAVRHKIKVFYISPLVLYQAVC